MIFCWHNEALKCNTKVPTLTIINSSKIQLPVYTNLPKKHIHILQSKIRVDFFCNQTTRAIIRRSVSPFRELSAQSVFPFYSPESFHFFSVAHKHLRHLEHLEHLEALCSNS